MKNFYDTSSLLLLANQPPQNFVISSITLMELERIKTSNNKNEEIMAAARQITYYLSHNPEVYEVHIFKPNMLKTISVLDITNDTKILATAIDYAKKQPIIFYTNDLALENFAKMFLPKDAIMRIEPINDEYRGYKEIVASEEELTAIYSSLNKNVYNLKIGEYLIIRNNENQIVDKLCWTGTAMRNISYGNFRSKWFGEVKPLQGDAYQALAADSFINNKITMLKGPAGSGKTYLALGFLLHKLEKRKIDKIIIFCNTLAAKGAAKLGFYPGTRDEKLLDSQIGNLLSAKLGDRIEVERMIQEGQLVLLPISDIRGFDTSGMNAGIYISEAQNLDINLMKLALQRIGEDNICIIDGDPLAQVDDESFAGRNNGMRRASQVFRGTPVYGEVELRKIHRSQIAQIAENM